MVDFVFSKSTHNDHQDIIALIQMNYEFHSLPIQKSEKLDEIVKTYVDDLSVGTQILAKLEGKLIAYATLSVTYSAIRMGQILVITELFVNPDYHGLTIGKQLFIECQKYAKEHNYEDMLWLTNTEKYALQVLYDKFGGGDKEHDFYY